MQAIREVPSLSSLGQRGVNTSTRSFASGDVTLDLEHATGLER